VSSHHFHLLSLSTGKKTLATILTQAPTCLTRRRLHLILLLTFRNEISLLYTRRSRHLRSHSFQISFPGGRLDDQDTSYVDCALRETEEEIGLPRHRIQVWGEANQLILPRTSSIVPVVGVVPDFSISELRLNWAEVEEAFSASSNAATSSEPPDGHGHQLITPAELIGAESQRRCMEKMRSLPSFPRPKALTPSRREKQTSAVLIALCQERGT